MRYAFALAALAGSTFAAPHYGAKPQTDKVEVVKNVHWVIETVTTTVYVTEGYETAQPTKATETTYEAPVVTSTYEEPAKTTTYEAAPPAPTTYEAAPPAQPTYEAPPAQPTYEAPAPAPTQPAPAPATNYMGVVDTWRSKLGLKKLQYSEKLQSNALNCVQSSNGVMVHKLNSGSYGQVLAPKDNDSVDGFEYVFVGGWLCERPGLPGLNGVCQKFSQGWDYQGQTGHADLLTSAQYSQIGCAWFEGIWACDLA